MLLVNAGVPEAESQPCLYRCALAANAGLGIRCQRKQQRTINEGRPWRSALGSRRGGPRRTMMFKARYCKQCVCSSHQNLISAFERWSFSMWCRGYSPDGIKPYARQYKGHFISTIRTLIHVGGIEQTRILRTSRDAHLNES